jgi:hypothetical protein
MGYRFFLHIALEPLEYRIHACRYYQQQQQQQQAYAKRYCTGFS